jgi:hypothetical protein
MTTPTGGDYESIRLCDDDLRISVDARNEAGEGSDCSGSAGPDRQAFRNEERTERFHTWLIGSTRLIAVRGPDGPQPQGAYRSLEGC